MKMKYHLFLGCVLVFPMILFLSTACNPEVGDTLIGGVSDAKEYVITQNGDINYPKDSALAVEYYTFLIDNYYNSRVLYFGGLVPSGYDPDELTVSLSCTGLQYSSYDEYYIKSYRFNSKDYYYVPITVQSDKNPNKYIITARLHKGSTDIITKTYTLKVAQYSNQGNWGLNVYQQVSYNKLDDTKDAIKSEFNKMGVEFGSNGVNIVNVKSDLPDSVIPYYHGTIDPTQDPSIKYAYETIYESPGINITMELMQQYFNNHQKEGVLFFVKDYNVINPPDPNLLGSTILGPWGNGVHRLAPISFVFIDRHLNVKPQWQGKYILYTTLHELGHLWCVGFTNDIHTLRHNSDNKDICLMKYNLAFDSYGDPDYNAQRILNSWNFCIGHLQHGANISWDLKQYSPFGEGTEGTFSPDIILFASNTSSTYSFNKGLEIELSCDQSDFIQGESINILIKIKNNTSDTVNISLEHYLHDLDTDSTFWTPYGVSMIPASGKSYHILDPSGWQLFPNRTDLSTFTLKPGNYEYYLSAIVGTNKYLSEKIKIKVNPVPDSLFQAFNDLKCIPNQLRSFETAEQLLKKYKGSFYEERYYYNIFGYGFYYHAIQNKDEFKNYRDKAIDLYREFILKYPNSSKAYSLFQVIMFNYKDNELLVEEILTSLKNNQPDCKLLEVLRNQPADNKQITHLLY